jgi:hypothetical protein
MEEARQGRFSAGPLTVAEKGKLPAMSERAGYPGRGGGSRRREADSEPRGR